MFSTDAYTLKITIIKKTNITANTFCTYTATDNRPLLTNTTMRSYHSNEKAIAQFC